MYYFNNFLMIIHYLLTLNGENVLLMIKLFLIRPQNQYHLAGLTTKATKVDQPSERPMGKLSSWASNKSHGTGQSRGEVLGARLHKKCI
jgi:hypothetical protein